LRPAQRGIQSGLPLDVFSGQLLEPNPGWRVPGFAAYCLIFFADSESLGSGQRVNGRPASRQRRDDSEQHAEHRAEQRVGDGVQKNVAIGVTAQAFVMGECDAANLQRNARLEFMGVEAVTDAGLGS